MKLVIFDLDGVIVSTDRYHYLAWKAVADQYGLLFNEEINHGLRGVSRAESLNIILEYNERDIPEETCERMLSEKNEIYRSSLKSLTENDILPGVLSLIEDLKNHGMKVAIGSSSRNTPMILKQLSMTDMFDIIIDGNMVTNSKPHPEVFAKGAKGLGINPKDCVVYEDAEAGIKAALAAGMFAVGVSGYVFEEAHYMVNSLSNESYDSLSRKVDQYNE